MGRRKSAGEARQHNHGGAVVEGPHLVPAAIYSMALETSCTMARASQENKTAIYRGWLGSKFVSLEQRPERILLYVNCWASGLP